MPLVTMRQLLDEAAAGDYGVAAFNVNNMEQIQGIMEAAQETQSPVIIQASRGARSYAGDRFLYHLMLAAAEAIRRPVAAGIYLGPSTYCSAGTAQMAPSAQVVRSRLSPLNQRRLQNFRANRRGVWSFWIFLFLFFGTLGAEFVANDKPLLVEYKGEYYAPIFKDYPEEIFGGFLPSPTTATPSCRRRSAAMAG